MPESTPNPAPPPPNNGASPGLCSEAFKRSHGFKSLENAGGECALRPPVKLPDDPLTWVLQNPHAPVILESLRDGAPHDPVEVRKSADIHPESFRLALHALELYDLVWMRAAKGAKWENSPRGRSIRMAIELSPKGTHMVRFLDQFRALVRKSAPELPRATTARWLEA